MPNIKSAKKRVLVNQTKAAKNKATNSALKTAIKKANAAIDAFKNGAKLVYVHVEGPDECGHRAEIENKVLSIEKIDSRVLTIYPMLYTLHTAGVSSTAVAFISRRTLSNAFSNFSSEANPRVSPSIMYCR